MTTTPITRIQRPRADAYAGKKSLFLAPNCVAPPGADDEGEALFERYWSEVRDSIANLERSLGAVDKVYHEFVFADGDDGLAQVEAMNPGAYPLIRAMLQSTAELRALEDAELVAEHMDWQRVLTVGTASRKVTELAVNGYQDTLAARYEAIAARVSSDLGEGERGALFIREDHRVQFGADTQVFYVSPPALNGVRNWLNDRLAAPPSPPTEGG